MRARCGPGRLWAFERVLDAVLEQQDTRRLTEVSSRLDCLRHCLLQDDFVCRCGACLQERHAGNVRQSERSPVSRSLVTSSECLHL